MYFIKYLRLNGNKANQCIVRFLLGSLATIFENRQRKVKVSMESIETEPTWRESDASRTRPRFITRFAQFCTTLMYRDTCARFHLCGMNRNRPRDNSPRPFGWKDDRCLRASGSRESFSATHLCLQLVVGTYEIKSTHENYVNSARVVQCLNKMTNRHFFTWLPRVQFLFSLAIWCFGRKNSGPKGQLSLPSAGCRHWKIY